MYTNKRDIFYYVEIVDKQVNRDNKISEIFGEDFVLYYIGCDNTHNYTKVTDIRYARFWKDLKSAETTKCLYSKTSERNQEIRVHQLNSDEFISSIPDEYPIENFITKKNLKLRSETVKHKKDWEVLRKKYKAISSYKKVDKPHEWIPCPKCNLIPIIWEYNNGKSTACGCGESEYNHFSIRAESIISYISRNNGSALGFDQNELMNNWNSWVRFGSDRFKDKKEKYKNIW